MEHPKDVGDRTTLAVMLALQEAGYEMGTPFGENMRYDLIIDDGARLARVQCKTGRLRGGAILFKTSSTYAHHRAPPQASRHYQGQIDFFGVYCRETGGVYLIPIDDVAPQWQAMLRVDAPRNSQRKRIRLAVDYQIGTVTLASVVVTRAPRASSGARRSSA